MPNSEASSQPTEPTKNLTAETVYEVLNSFSKDFETTPEKLEISYPEGKNAKGVFEEISSLIEEGKKEVATTGEKPENSLSPSQKIAEKIAEIKDSKIQDYRVEAFANCALKVFESEGNDQDSKNKVLEKLTSAFSFLGEEEGKEEGKETNKEAKQNKEIEQFTGALKAINTDQEIEVGLKQDLVGSFRDAFMKKKEPEPNKENSTEPENSSPETSNSQDDEKAKTKDNPEKHFLDNYNVNYQSAGAAAAKLSIAIALCFVAPPIGFLLSAGFCAATPSWGQNAITKKKDHEIENGFLGKEATEKQEKEKEQEPEVIKKALSSAIEEVVKGKENAAEPTLEPRKAENTNEPAALATTQATATKIENPAVETTGNQPQANINSTTEASATQTPPTNEATTTEATTTEAQPNTNPTTEPITTTQTQAANEATTTQTPAEAIGSKDVILEFVNTDSDKKDGTRPAETLTEASSGTTHSDNANKSFIKKLSVAASEVKNNLTTYLSGNKNSGEVLKVANPLLNSEENTNSGIFVGGSTEEPTTFGNRFLDLAEAVKIDEFSSATSVEGNNNPTKDSKSQFPQNSANIPSPISEGENKKSSLPKQGSKDDSDLQLESKVAKIAENLRGKISKDDSNFSPKAPQTPSPQINNWMTNEGRQ